MMPQNLFQLLEATAEKYPHNGLLFYQPGKVEAVGKELKYPDLLQRSKENAKSIHQLGLGPGAIILLHFNNHLENLEWFWAVICAGYIPALSTPFTNNIELRRKHILHLQSVLDNPVCLTTKGLLSEFAVQDVLRLYTIDNLPTPLSSEQNDGLSSGHNDDLSSGHNDDLSIERKEQLTSEYPEYLRNGHTDHLTNGYTDHLTSTLDQGSSKPSDALAVLMLTSGSTGNAKAVALTHRQMLISLAGKNGANNTAADGPFLSWIGVDHVATLTETHLHAMWAGAEQIHVQATDLLPNPLLFMDLINKHRVAYSFAPNFFLASLRRALERPDAAEFRSTLNLSCLHTIVTGGEANVVETCIALTKLLQEHGTSDNVLSPAFGMTETCAGSIYSKDCPRRDIECNNEIATLGSCIAGIEMRITNEDGNDIGRDKSGNLEVGGPIVFKEYYNNPKATAESFNGKWFVTGDLACIDSLGQLNLTGRAKETMIINGVKYSPHEIETALEDVSGAKPSYTVVFPFRPKGSQTESICVVYYPIYLPDDVETRVKTNDALSKAAMLQTGVRPYVIPLDGKILQKTTLGKLSRIKIRMAFEKGEYQEYQSFNDDAVAQHRAASYKGPANPTEELILNVFQEIFGALEYELGVNTNLFAMGVNSVDIIRVKQRLQMELKIENIPVITVMTNPSIRTLSSALESLQKPREYNPMVVLQSQGSKAPLWLIHPGVGEVLVFLALASHITDRPVYAMRARGFEQGEEYFTSWDEAVTRYYSKIKDVQPKGPYAIAGYSYGSMIAFEIAKRLNAHDDEVGFLGAFNLPPHIKMRMRQLDWTNCLLHLSYFLDFFSEDDAHAIYAKLQGLPREEILEHVVGVARADRMAELGLDKAKLTNWADLANSLQSSATDYEPVGMVESIDVFCAVPLAAVARDMEDWKTNHLGKWADFSRTKPRLHEVDGAHYTMMSPTHVYSFQKKLKAALAERGV